jgi:Protein of unknown function (DUF3363)
MARERERRDDAFIRAGTSPDRDLTATEFEQVVANLVTHRGGRTDVSPSDFGGGYVPASTLRYGEFTRAAVITPAGRIHDVTDARATAIGDEERVVGGHRALGMSDAGDVHDLLEAIHHYTRRTGDVVEVSSYVSLEGKALSGSSQSLTAAQIASFGHLASSQGFDGQLMRRTDRGVELRAAGREEIPELRQRGYVTTEPTRSPSPGGTDAPGTAPPAPTDGPQSSVATAIAKLSAETGLPYTPAANGEFVSGIYRESVAAASGRYAMIDNGLGFALVPWTQDLDQHLGRHFSGVAMESGGIEWNFGCNRGLEI